MADFCAFRRSNTVKNCDLACRQLCSTLGRQEQAAVVRIQAEASGSGRAASASALRTAGATLVPKSSIEFISLSCGSVPTLNWIRKRSWLEECSCW